jgi:hypothetical protein
MNGASYSWPIVHALTFLRTLKEVLGLCVANDVCHQLDNEYLKPSAAIEAIEFI